MEKAKTAKAKKIIGTVANVLVWIFLVFSILVTVLAFSAQGSKGKVPSLFGKSLVTIESWSMEPTFKKGDLVLMQKLEFDEITQLQPGTIITYISPDDINGDGVKGDINTHRIESLVNPGSADGGFKTWGDNRETNPVPDDYVVHYGSVIGIVEEDDCIRGLGGVIGFLRSSLGFLICIVIPLALFFFYELYRFIALLVTEKAKRAPVSAETEEEIRRRAIEEYIKSQAAQSTAAPENKPDEGNE